MNVNKKLTIRKVAKTFSATNLEVLKDVSLFVRAGEFVSIIGPSGCGKSTILDCIAGLTSPDNGEIILDNKSILHKSGEAAYMMQDDNLFPWRTILDNVIVPLEIAGVEKSLGREQAQKMLHIFGLEKFMSYYPFMLSGGMRQRASLLRTYLCKKDVLLLDEPFARLDALTRRQMQEWFLSIWQQDKRSVLFVTHDIDEAILLSDRIYVMSKRPGTIIAEIPVKLKRPRISTDKECDAIKKQIISLL